MNRRVIVMGGVDVSLNGVRVTLSVDDFAAVLTPAEARTIGGLLLACAEAAEDMQRTCCPPPADG